MTRHAAFMRGINVGGHKKVPMAALKEVMESAGFQDVKTILASGNVLFSAKLEDDSKDPGMGC
ncbi:MAG: DUF1697 domain-containing protein [Armatimonadetes bacterium]|nr:DUF1697 domain-containing protein [Armatimonadota bacterium]